MNPLYCNIDTRIHSAIADPTKFANSLGGNCALLWYYCRACDPNGSGRVQFHIKDAAIGLNRSVPTIKRYLRRGVEMGFFRQYFNNHGLITVYMASLENVGIANELPSLGVFGDLPVAELKHLKFWSTQLIAQSLQSASMWRAKNRQPYPQGVKLVEPEDVLTAPSSGSSGVKAKPILKRNKEKGRILYRGKRCTFVSASFIPYGVSQKRIAEENTRHISTVKRRLCNRYRSDRGVEPLPKTQIAQAIVDDGVSRFALEYASEFDDRTLSKLFTCKGMVFESRCNVYARQFDLRSGKMQKWKYRSRFEKTFPCFSSNPSLN